MIDQNIINRSSYPIKLGVQFGNKHGKKGNYTEWNYQLNKTEEKLETNTF